MATGSTALNPQHKQRGIIDAMVDEVEEAVEEKVIPWAVRHWKFIAGMVAIVASVSIGWAQFTSHEKLPHHEPMDVRVKKLEANDITQRLEIADLQKQIDKMPNGALMESEMRHMRDDLKEIKDGMKELKKIAEARSGGNASAGIARRPTVKRGSYVGDRAHAINETLRAYEEFKKQN